MPSQAWPHVGALLACVALTACAQLCLKSGTSGRAASMTTFMHWRVLLGYGTLAVVAVLAVYAGQKLPMKVITAAQSVTYVLVLAGAWTLLGERPTRGGLVGAALIVLGVLVFSL